MNLCGELTQKGTRCRWRLEECPIKSHQRARDRRVEERYLRDHPVLPCSRVCEASMGPVEACDCMCGGVNHGQAHARHERERSKRIATVGG